LVRYRYRDFVNAPSRYHIAHERYHERDRDRDRYRYFDHHSNRYFDRYFYRYFFIVCRSILFKSLLIKTA